MEPVRSVIRPLFQPAGRLIEKKTLSFVHTELRLNTSALPAVAYIVKIESDDGKMMRAKMLKSE